MYSDTIKLEPTLTAQDVTNYMTDYISREYPDFVFYYYRDGYPLTPELGTVGYDIVWSNCKCQYINAHFLSNKYAHFL